MARPRKVRVEMTASEQLQAVKKEIEALNASLREKKAQIKALEARAAEEKKDALMAAISASGKSIDEVIEMLK
ncbi:MAG: flagellar export protein FliJ [Oscillospiraceae bacterium]|nr:flagellar export protein FliJ [Oscillospiraceae bacterium]